MKVIPVLDVKNGLVVLARMGLRNLYKPLRSWLCPFSSPVATVKVLASLGFKTVYLADLDAISRRTFSLDLYRVLSSEMDLMVDPGVRSLEDALKVIEAGVDKLVVATETIASLQAARRILETLSCKHAILSLDLRNRRVLSRALELKDLTPLTCLEKMAELGFKEAIVVDLAKVGSFTGPDFELIRKLRKVPVKLIVGGGVRSTDDLIALEREGVEAALVASALHKSKLSIAVLKRMGFI